MLKQDKFMVVMLILFPLLGFLGDPRESWPWVIGCEMFLGFVTYLFWGIKPVQTSSECEKVE